MKRVIFLGSGFSKAIYPQMPTLSELSAQVESSINKSDDPIISALYGKIPDAVKSNVEFLLSYLYLKLPWKNDMDINADKLLYIHVTKTINGIIQGTLKDIGAIAEDEKKRFDELLKYMNYSKTTIITLNYDTILENCFLNSQKATEYTQSDFNYILESKYCSKRKTNDESNMMEIDNEKKTLYLSETLFLKDDEFLKKVVKQNNIQINIKILIEHIKNRPGYSEDMLYNMPTKYIEERGSGSFWGSNEYKTLNVIKLHGSVNWYISGLENSDNEQIYRTQNISGGMNEKEKYYSEDLMPFIIPPILDKNGFYTNGLLRSLWKRAHKELFLADQIDFIGFSLPQSDYAIQMLLSSAIRKDAKISIVNKPASTKEEKKLQEKYSALFNLNNLNFKYCSAGNDECFFEYLEDEIIV